MGVWVSLVLWCTGGWGCRCGYCVWLWACVATVCGCGPVWVLCLVVVVLLSDGKEGTTPAVARRRSHSSLTRTFHANCGRCFQLLSWTVTLFLVLQFVTNFSNIYKITLVITNVTTFSSLFIFSNVAIHDVKIIIAHSLGEGFTYLSNDSL